MISSAVFAVSLATALSVAPFASDNNQAKPYLLLASSSGWTTQSAGGVDWVDDFAFVEDERGNARIYFGCYWDDMLDGLVYFDLLTGLEYGSGLPDKGQILLDLDGEHYGVDGYVRDRDGELGFSVDSFMIGGSDIAGLIDVFTTSGPPVRIEIAPGVDFRFTRSGARTAIDDALEYC